MVGVPPSCTLLGGFAIGARVALLTNDNTARTRNVSEYMLVLALSLVFVGHAVCLSLFQRNQRCSAADIS